MEKKENEKGKVIFWYLVGFALLVGGIDGIIRTYCVSLPDTTHLAHECLVYTSPLSYLASIVVIFIGFYIIWLNNALS